MLTQRLFLVTAWLCAAVTTYLCTVAWANVASVLWTLKSCLSFCARPTTHVLTLSERQLCSPFAVVRCWRWFASVLKFRGASLSFCQEHACSKTNVTSGYTFLPAKKPLEWLPPFCSWIHFPPSPFLSWRTCLLILCWMGSDSSRVEQRELINLMCCKKTEEAWWGGRSCMSVTSTHTER